MEEQQQLQTGIPVNLTKEEFTQYYTVIGKLFGSERMLKPTMVIYGLYLVLIAGFGISDYIKFGTVSVVMIILFLMTAISGTLLLILAPLRTKKTAEILYEAGNFNGYYGELVITPTEIIKHLGEESVSAPLNENTMFLETADFMVFSTVGQTRTIILPARCLTEETAKQIREVLFAESCRVKKRIVKRMTAKAEQPIERQDMTQATPVLAQATIALTEDELKKHIADMSWKKYVETLPINALLGLMLGSILAAGQELLPVMLLTVAAVMIGSLIITLIGQRVRVNRTLNGRDTMNYAVTLTEQGVSLYMGGTVGRGGTILRWSHMKTAVEHPSFLQFTGLGQCIRVPKRCIDNVEEWKTIVDSHFEK